MRATPSSRRGGRSNDPAAPTVDVVDAIRTKRHGGELTESQIDGLISGYTLGTIPDYQMSALLMAICWRGLSQAETLQLTHAMVRSGDVLAPGAVLGRRIVDKHSTGGVGDKATMAVAPIVAACGVPMGKMSGRGLGHTGGTLDKLESIPGFRVDIEEQRFIEQVRDIGIAIAGQTADLVPADKALYALRDVTATVESIPLIAASIMSKKLAGGADAIVLDVKVGSGAFIQEIEEARKLADEMIAIGTGAGREVRVLLTSMDRPLGRMVGNALEVREIVELLDGDGPADLLELVLALSAALLSLSDLEVTEQAGRELAREAIESGAARRTWNAWIRAQGGDPDAAMEVAPVEHTVLAHEAGVITRVDALTVGRAAVLLGAGRRKKGDVVDHAVGIELHASVGDQINAGDPLLTIHARSDEAAHQAATMILAEVRIQPAAQVRRGTLMPIVIEQRDATSA